MQNIHELIQLELAKHLSKGYDASHDDHHTKGEIAAAALSYLTAYAVSEAKARVLWPFEARNFRVPELTLRGRIDFLVTIISLLIAEANRLRRLLEKEEMEDGESVPTSVSTPFGSKPSGESFSEILEQTTVEMEETRNRSQRA